MKKPANVQEYLASIPPTSRSTLNKLRRTIREVAPRATEVMSYGIPTFKDSRMLVAYAAFAHHCSFFPMNAALIGKFGKELGRFETSKGTVRFPIGGQLPSSVVKKIVRIRVRQNKEREQAKRGGKRNG
jgi:uncharacterized protein YdhG (YjbR/CyaY superfamily)